MHSLIYKSMANQMNKNVISFAQTVMEKWVFGVFSVHTELARVTM